MPREVFVVRQVIVAVIYDVLDRLGGMIALLRGDWSRDGFGTVMAAVVVDLSAVGRGATILDRGDGEGWLGGLVNKMDVWICDGGQEVACDQR